MKKEIILLIAIGIIMLFSIIALIIYFFNSERTNEEIKNYNVKNGINSFNVLYNEKNKRFTIYDDTNRNTTYNIDRFIGKHDRHRVADFITEYHKTGDLTNSIIVRFSLTNKLYKVEFENYKEHIFYGKAYYVDDNVYENIDTSNRKFLDYEDFKKHYNSSKTKKISSIYVVKFELFQTILKRYGEEIAEQYIRKLYYLMERNIKKENGEYMSFYSDDSFLIYRPGFISALRIREIVKYKLKELTTLLYVESYKFEVTPKVGVYQIYSSSVKIDEAIDNADRATNLVNGNQRYYIFDDKAEKIKNEDQRKLKAFEEYSVNLPKEITFVDIVSYIGGENIGLFPHIKNEETVYKDYYFYSVEHRKRKQFVYNTLNSTLSKFLEIKTNQRLFIFMQFDSLATFKQILANHEEYKQIRIVAVIIDYKPLLENMDKKREILRDINSLGITLGITADKEMLVSMSGLMHLFKWLIIPSKLANLVSDEKEYLTLRNLTAAVERMNLNVIAHNISKYEVAKVLKDIGVDFISGSVLSQEYGEYNSTRRISKLIEERIN